MSGKGKQLLESRQTLWVVWGAVAVLIILFGSAFARAWRTNRILREELNTLQPMIVAAVQEKEALETRLAYVQSDEYVEAWAQTRAGMTRPGETLVIGVAATPTPLPLSVEPPLPEPTPAPFWPRLWQMVIGE